VGYVVPIIETPSYVSIHPNLILTGTSTGAFSSYVCASQRANDGATRTCSFSVGYTGPSYCYGEVTQVSVSGVPSVTYSPQPPESFEEGDGASFVAILTIPAHPASTSFSLDILVGVAEECY
jgi:hypothetical protein